MAKIKTRFNASIFLFLCWLLLIYEAILTVSVVWSAVHEYLKMVGAGHATLEDILLLFIYLELGAMVGIYFKTHRLPVQYLIYIAITALSRHLVIDV